MSEKMTSGEAFRQAREAQGKTLEDAHGKTGITVKVLRQLEADEASAVEAVYLRLAARAYAEYLGLDPDEAAEQVRAPAAAPGPSIQRPVPVKIASSNASRPTVAAKERRSTPLGRLLILGAVGLVILLALVYVFEQMDRADRSVPTMADTSESDSDLGAVQPSSDPVVVDTPADPVETATPEASEAAGQVPPVEAEPEVEPEVEALVLDEALLLEEAPLVLELEAKTSTWVRVKWDGEGRFEGTLPAGARRRWEAQQYLTVLSGRPRGFHYWFQNELIDNKLLVNPSGVLNFRATLSGIHIYPAQKPSKPAAETTATPTANTNSTSPSQDPPAPSQADEAPASEDKDKTLSNDRSNL